MFGNILAFASFLGYRTGPQILKAWMSRLSDPGLRVMVEDDETQAQTQSTYVERRHAGCWEKS